MSVNLSFHGAADTVTGSCHLVRTGGLSILVDCGMFQGERDVEAMNYGDFPFKPADIDFLLLTHGHLDHCGRIPVLVKQGFRGRIICTSATYDIAKIILMDAAKIQEEDFAHWRKVSQRAGRQPRRLLYSTPEAQDALKFFDGFADYGKPFRLTDSVAATFRDAGHIIGASFVELDIKGRGRITFSGDLGNRSKPIVRDPETPAPSGTAVVEGTYADRNHKCIEDSVEELLDAIVQTFIRGGNVLIPAFAIERSQEILFFLRKLHNERRLPPCSIFLDTPMGINATEIFRRHPECFDEETLGLFNNHEDPFTLPGLSFTRSQEESVRINQMRSQAVIIAGSGMCTGGRILHHLKHNIWREECSIIFTGFQAEGTLGRRIVDREEDVEFFGQAYKVRAQVHTIGGFSSHADHDMLYGWLSSMKGLEHLFLVHGERSKLKPFARELKDNGIARNVHIPALNQSFEI